MQNIKLGNLDEDGKSINDVEKALKRVNIELRDTPTSFRNMSDVISDVAEKWSGFDEVTKASIAQAMSGTRQYENLATLLSNWTLQEKLKTEAMNSGGLAMQRYGKYIDSVEAATNRLTAAWEKLVAGSLSSDTIKFFINLGTALLGVADALGIVNIAVVALGAYFGGRFLVTIPLVTNAILNFAGAAGVATLAVSTLASVITGGLIAVAVVGAIAIFNELNVTIDKTYDQFQKLKNQTSDNQKELKDLALEYETLASKQKKSGDDVQRLIEIQGILNNKYGALKDGVNIYTDAIDGNSEAIKKNIQWMKEQASQQAINFIAENKFKYEDAKKYLAETVKVGTTNAMGGFDQFVGEKTKIELLEMYAKKAEETSGAEHDIWVKNYENLTKEIALRKQLVAEYENYLNATHGREPAENRRGGDQSDFVDIPEKTEVASKSVEKLQDELDKAISSFSSMGSQVESLIEKYTKYGEIESEDVAQLRKTFGEDFVDAVDIQNGRIRLNIQGLKDLSLARINEALTSAEALLATDRTNKKLIEQYNILFALQQQAQSGTLFSAKSQENKEKAYQDVLKMTIDMIKQKKDAEKDALKESLDAFKKSIDARKDALEKQADSEKQHLQDQLDGYKAIIQAEKDLIDQRAREEDFQDKVAEKNKQISDIDAQLLAMQFDNSEEAKAKRLQLEDEKTKVLKELGKIQKDNTIENQKEALDKEIDGYEKGIKAKQTIIERNLASQKEALDQEYADFEANINAKIAKIDEYMKQAGTITSDAMTLMASKSDSFYQSLIEWNRKFGDSVDQNIIAKLNEAFGLQMMLSSFGGGGSYSGGNTGGGGTGPIGSPGYNYYSPPEYHHEGGIAGGAPKLKETEVFAKLMRGEPVITEKQAYNFMKNTLPNLVNAGGGEIKIDMPITIMGNCDKSVIPDIKNAVLEVVNGALKDRGTRRNAFSFSGG